MGLYLIRYGSYPQLLVTPHPHTKRDFDLDTDPVSSNGIGSTRIFRLLCQTSNFPFLKLLGDRWMRPMGGRPQWTPFHPVK